MSTKKIWRQVISMLLVLALLPVSALAQYCAVDPQVVTEPKFKVERFYVDPEMERLGLTVGQLPQYDFAALGSETMEDLAEAGVYVREQMENRVEAFSVTVNNYEFAGEAQLMEDLLTVENALMVHTGEPTQGDYIRRHLTQYGYSVSVTSTQLISNWTVVYKTNAEQEKVVDERVDELIAQWDAAYDINDLTDEEKITLVYDYICENVVYDYDHLAMGSGYPLMFSAYAALIDGTAVCQGYSNLFYRLALELGVDTRIISGFGNGGPHSWNIAQLGESYYYLDSTWDAGRADYAYFLLGSKAFLWDHALDEEFKAEAFQKEYPISESNYDFDAGLIEEATQAGLLIYFESFTMDGELTRLDLAKLVAALAELTLDSDASLSYEDCDDLTDEEKQIIAAVESFGVMQGYNDATFRPLETVNRATAAVVVYRALNGGVDVDDIGDYADDGLFSDVSASSWYAPYVNYLAGIGVIPGDKNGNFTPMEPAIFNAVLRWVVNAAGLEFTLAAPAVTATNIASTGKIKLSWDKVDGAEKYEVYRATSKNGSYTRITTTTKTSITNTKTEYGKTYYYKVRAIAGDVQGEFSEVVSRTCDLAQPEVKVSNIASTGKIKLSWDKVDGAVKYEVYRATGKNGTYTKLTTTTKTSVTNTKTEAGVTYYYKVKAIAEKSAANSAYSVIVGRTCDLAQPKVKATNIASTGKIKLSWDKVDGAVKYEVYRATSKNGTYTKLTTTTKTSVTNTKTEAGVTYYYKVKAIAKSSAANSAYSEIVGRTCDLARPEVTVKLNSKVQPVVSWKKVSGAVKYEVWRATSENGTYTKITTTTKTSITNTKTEAGMTYYYKVKAISSTSAANSAYSVVVSVSTATEAVTRYIYLAEGVNVHDMGDYYYLTGVVDISGNTRGVAFAKDAYGSATDTFTALQELVDEHCRKLVKVSLTDEIVARSTDVELILEGEITDDTVGTVRYVKQEDYQITEDVLKIGDLVLNINCNTLIVNEKGYGIAIADLLDGNDDLYVVYKDFTVIAIFLA